MQELDLSRNNKEWSQEDDALLTEQYPKVDVVEKLAAQLKRPPCSIYQRAYVLRVQRQTLPRLKISEVEDLDWKLYFLRHNTNLSTTEIGARLGLTKHQVRNRLYTEGLIYHPPAGEPPEWYKTGEIDF